MTDTTSYIVNRNSNGRPQVSFLTSAWYSSSARCCSCETAAITRSSSISMSPWATAWGSILIARIWPRPSAVACTIPPPAEQVTVCCASCDWISDSRNCICCPSWSRLDKSAIRRKLPLTPLGCKLFQQLQVQRVHSGAEARIFGAQRPQPLLPRALLRHPRRTLRGPLPAPRSLQRDAHGLDHVTPHQLRQRIPLPLDALGVHRVGIEQADAHRAALHHRHFRDRKQRAEQRAPPPPPGAAPAPAPAPGDPPSAPPLRPPLPPRGPLAASRPPRSRIPPGPRPLRRGDRRAGTPP